MVSDARPNGMNSLLMMLVCKRPSKDGSRNPLFPSVSLSTSSDEKTSRGEKVTVKQSDNDSKIKDRALYDDLLDYVEAEIDSVGDLPRQDAIEAKISYIYGTESNGVETQYDEHKNSTDGFIVSEVHKILSRKPARNTSPRNLKELPNEEEKYRGKTCSSDGSFIRSKYSEDLILERHQDAVEPSPHAGALSADGSSCCVLQKESPPSSNSSIASDELYSVPSQTTESSPSRYDVVDDDEIVSIHSKGEESKGDESNNNKDDKDCDKNKRDPPADHTDEAMMDEVPDDAEPSRNNSGLHSANRYEVQDNFVVLKSALRSKNAEDMPQQQTKKARFAEDVDMNSIRSSQSSFRSNDAHYSIASGSQKDACLNALFCDDISYDSSVITYQPTSSYRSTTSTASYSTYTCDSASVVSENSEEDDSCRSGLARAVSIDRSFASEYSRDSMYWRDDLSVATRRSASSMELLTNHFLCMEKDRITIDDWFI